MIRAAVIIGALLNLALTGCCPITSLHPLATPGEATFDARLVGTWYGGSTDNDGAFLHFGKGFANSTQVLVVKHKPNGLMDQVSFPVFISRVQKQYYINIDLQQLRLKETSGYNGFILVKYHFPDTDTLVFSDMDETKLTHAINNHQVAGEITYAEETPSRGGQKTPPGKIDCVRVTDTSENLRKFLTSKEAEQLFTPYMTLKRIKP